MTTELKQRLKALRKIQVEARLKAYGHGSRAFLPTSIGLILGGVIGAVFYGAMPLLVLLGIIVGGAIGYKTTKQKDRAEFIYERLAAYQPLDEQAYRDLQELAKESKMTATDVLAWVDIETQAIQPRKPSQQDIARQRFVAK